MTGKLWLSALVLSVCQWAVAADQKFSLQVSGAYSEFGGSVNFDGALTPLVPQTPFDPFDPVFVPGTPVPVELPQAFDDDDAVWEAQLNYRLNSHLTIQGGYSDLGTFSSDAADLAVPAAFANPGIPLGPGLTPVGGPIFVGGTTATFAPPQVDLEAEAIMLGLRADHSLFDRARVFARLGLLQTSYDVSDVFFGIELEDPSDETGWYWGVGVQYELLPRLLLSVGYSQYDTGLHKPDQYQAGVEFLIF